MIERFLFVTKQTMNSFINHLVDEIILKRLRGLYKKSESFLIRFFLNLFIAFKKQHSILVNGCFHPGNFAKPVLQ
jgi:hypothetical protein